jgi:hypothetical protein
MIDLLGHPQVLDLLSLDRVDPAVAMRIARYQASSVRLLRRPHKEKSNSPNAGDERIIRITELIRQ